MTINNRTKLKVVSWISALALAATFAASVSAEESGSPPPGDAKATNSGTPPRYSSPAGENAAPPSSGANGEDIDTRITVQPHGPVGKSGKLGEKTNPIQPIKLINAHRRTFSPSRSAGHVTPNVLGVTGGQHPNLQQGPSEHFESKGVGATTAIGTAAGVGSANIGFAKPANNLGRPPIFRSTGLSPLSAGTKTLIRGGIGGPSSNRHTVGLGTAAGIGGPARTATGINGTSIRATH
jgi:hypothetical protein